MSAQPYKEYFMERPNALHSFCHMGSSIMWWGDTLGEPEK